MVWAKPRSIVRPRRFSSCQPVGVGAGQGQHERRLPVVDVPGGGDDRHRSGGDRGAGERSEQRLDDDAVVRRVDGAQVEHRRRRHGRARSRGDGGRAATLPRSPRTATPIRGQGDAGRRAGARQRFHRLGADVGMIDAPDDVVGALTQLVDGAGDHRPERDALDVAIEVGEHGVLQRADHESARSQRAGEGMPPATIDESRRGRR